MKNPFRGDTLGEVVLLVVTVAAYAAILLYL